MKNIFPDRVVRNFNDDLVTAGGRYIVDTIVIAPDSDTHAAAAALKSLAAAEHAYAREKFRTYNAHLKDGDKLLAVVCETNGDLHDSVKQRLVRWAKLLEDENTSAHHGSTRFSVTTSKISVCVARSGGYLLRYSTGDSSWSRRRWTRSPASQLGPGRWRTGYLTLSSSHGSWAALGRGSKRPVVLKNNRKTTVYS
jgi:hypothetical protein